MKPDPKMTVDEETSPLLSGERGDSSESLDDAFKTKTISGFQTGLNLVKLALGSGVLTIPYAFSQAGILGGLLALTVSAAMNFWSVEMLVKCHDKTSAEAKRATTFSYSAILYDIYGPRGVYIIETAMFFCCFGAVIAYMIFFTSTMADVSDVLSRKGWVIFSTPFLAAMVCLNDFSWLSFMSLGAIVGVLISFATVFAYGAAEHELDVSGVGGVLPGGLANFFSIAAFAYAYPVCFFPFYDQMRKTKPAQFMRVFSVTVLIVSSLFAILGIGTMAFFYKTGVQQVIIDNLPKDTIYAKTVRVAMAVVIFLSYPLAFLNITQTVCAKLRTFAGKHAKHVVDYGSRIGLCVLSALVAIAVPNMADLIAVVGAFAISLLSFVLPPFVYYKMFEETMSPRDQWGVKAYFLVSVGIMAFATFSAMKTLVSHLHQ